MKALIQKDFYVLWKQMRIFVIIMLVFAAANGAFGSVFIVLWSAMLPYTAMAYDERCKWDQMAAMLPYSTRDIVLSKYVLGWLLSGGAGLIALAVQAIMRVTGFLPAGGNFATVLMGICGSLCVLGITLPLMLRFGVERGRMVMFLLIFLVCAVSGSLSTVLVTTDGSGSLHVPSAALILAPAAAVAITAVSIPLSMRLYAARQ